MTCRELENLLGQPLPPEAQEHVSTCKACRALVQWFETPLAVESASVESMPKLPATRPVRPLPSPLWTAGGILAAGGILVATASWHLGLAGWETLDFARKLAIFSALSIVGFASATMLARQMFPLLALRVSPVVCIAAAVAAIIAGPLSLMPWAYDSETFVEFGTHCAQYGAVYSVAALACTLLLIRRGYFLRPGWAGALAGLVSGTIALIVLQIYCPLVESSHVLAWHTGVAVASVVLSAIVANRASKRQA